MITARTASWALLLMCVGCADDAIGHERPPVDEGAATSGMSTLGEGDTASGDDSSGPSDSGQNNSDGFVPDDDFTGVSQCDPFFQDCEPGQKCVPYSHFGGNWDANKCVEVLGDGAVGEPCTYDGSVEATDSCDASSMCWNVGDVDGEAIGTCMAFCTGSADDPQCAAGSSCSISCDGSLTVCIDNCDPLLQDCLGLGCYWASNNFSCIFTAGEGLAEGEACGFINDCAPGLMCIDGLALPTCAGAACCSAFCDLSAPSCLVPGTECVAWFEEGMAPEGFEKVGICLAVAP